jgi:hypothetical protein
MKNLFASLAPNYTPLAEHPETPFVAWSKEIQLLTQDIAMIFQPGPGNHQYRRLIPKQPKGKKAIRETKRALVRARKNGML